ncbi:MAG: HAMP domain-containing protein [Proteobacteria bacterium]|nr:HAMP domain-containing protein [Pseudomonadota bacterium]MBU4009262.1 HAMP domain-containing protein [Pseudomonadota bacterium]
MKKRYPLFLKLYLPFLLIVLVPLFIEGKYTDFSMRRFFLEQVADNLESTANLLEENTASLISDKDQSTEVNKNIDILCKRAGKSSKKRITVMSVSGKVLGDSEKNPDKMENHSDRPEFVKAMTGETGVFTRHSDTLKRKMMYLAIPITEKGKFAGVIRASVSISEIDRQLDTIKKRLFFGMILVSLFAAFAAFLFSRRISQPLERIHEGAEHFAEGDLNYRLSVFDSPETELLARTMNGMAANLNDRMQTIIRQQKEIEAILSSMTEGLVAVNMEEKIISVNSSVARMFHRPVSELINRSVQEVVRNPELHQFVRKAFLDESPHETDLSFYFDGETLLNIRSTPLKNAGGYCIGILFILNDVTRLRHLENMRRDFAANVSHEIKTPLTAIKGFTETLKAGALNKPEEAFRFVGIIENHTNRLISIIDDLMKLSFIEQNSAGQEIALTECLIRPILLSAIQICRLKADEKKIKIVCICDEGLSAKINADLFGQAFVNLIDNAIKYSEPETSVEIEAAKNESGITIVFRDHGIGISPEHIPRLFERFYRVDASRSRKLGGTGLGLAIVKHIVNANGGDISVESKPGKGSSFCIHIPNKAC